MLPPTVLRDRQNGRLFVPGTSRLLLVGRAGSKHHPGFDSGSCGCSSHPQPWAPRARLNKKSEMLSPRNREKDMMTNRTIRLPDATAREEKRIFTVVSQTVIKKGKTIRHILVFDNHPASLDLLRSIDVAARRRSKLVYAVPTIALVLAAGLGMFWPLLNS
jgi:hypothetical protein